MKSRAFAGVKARLRRCAWRAIQPPGFSRAMDDRRWRGHQWAASAHRRSWSDRAGAAHQSPWNCLSVNAVHRSGQALPGGQGDGAGTAWQRTGCAGQNNSACLIYEDPIQIRLVAERRHHKARPRRDVPARSLHSSPAGRSYGACSKISRSRRRGSTPQRRAGAVSPLGPYSVSHPLVVVPNGCQTAAST